MSHPRRIDETGNRYGRLTVLRVGEKRTRKILHWLCKCDCGNEAEVRGYNLRCGKATSCGCKLSEHQRRYGFKYIVRNKQLLLDSDDDDILR
jgi:hypothetical protein